MEPIKGPWISPHTEFEILVDHWTRRLRRQLDAARSRLAPYEELELLEHLLKVTRELGER